MTVSKKDIEKIKTIIEKHDLLSVDKFSSLVLTEQDNLLVREPEVYEMFRLYCLMWELNKLKTRVKQVEEKIEVFQSPSDGVQGIVEP